MSGASDRGTTAAPPLDDIVCGLLVTDAEGLVVWANRAFCEWTGRLPGDLVGQLRFQDLLGDGSRGFFASHWLPLLEQQGAVHEAKIEMQRPDGSAMALAMNAARRMRGGATVTDLAFFPVHDQDLNDREMAASREELRLLVHEATRMEEDAKDRALFAEQMVGIVSHDLRNPLSAIHMGVLALTRGELTTNQIRVLGRVSRSTERAHRLIADLLDFTAARIGPGLAVKPQPIDLHGAVAEAVEELATAFPDRTLVHRHSGEGLCLADPDRLSQLVGNLVANAMAYGDPARPVTVSSAIDGTHASVSVHNFGTPIPAGAIGSLFRPMVRGDTSGAARSVGLGLYIVAEIARAHQGEVSVQSGADTGTSFTATLPLA